MPHVSQEIRRNRIALIPSISTPVPDQRQHFPPAVIPNVGRSSGLVGSVDIAISIQIAAHIVRGANNPRIDLIGIRRVDDAILGALPSTPAERNTVREVPRSFDLVTGRLDDLDHIGAPVLVVVATLFQNAIGR